MNIVYLIDFYGNLEILYLVITRLEELGYKFSNKSTVIASISKRYLVVDPLLSYSSLYRENMRKKIYLEDLYTAEIIKKLER